MLPPPINASGFIHTSSHSKQLDRKQLSLKSKRNQTQLPKPRPVFSSVRNTSRESTYSNNSVPLPEAKKSESPGNKEKSRSPSVEPHLEANKSRTSSISQSPEKFKEPPLGEARNSRTSSRSPSPRAGPSKFRKSNDQEPPMEAKENRMRSRSPINRDEPFGKYKIPRKINSTDMSFEKNIEQIRRYLNNESSRTLLDQIRNSHIALVNHRICHWFNLKKCNNKYEKNDRGLVSCIDYWGISRVHACLYCSTITKLQVKHRGVSCPLLRKAISHNQEND